MQSTVEAALAAFKLPQLKQNTVTRIINKGVGNKQEIPQGAERDF